MGCSEVRALIFDYLDSRLLDRDFWAVQQHLKICAECRGLVNEFEEIRESLRKLPTQPVPEKLHLELLILASRESRRRRIRRNFALRVKEFCEDVKLLTDSLVRPVLGPLSAGVVVAVFLFHSILPNLSIQPSHTQPDVPLPLNRPAELVAMGPAYNFPEDLLVEVLVNEEGEPVDYKIVQAGERTSIQDLANLGRLVFSSRFNPARKFGQPQVAKVLIYFSRSHIDVVG